MNDRRDSDRRDSDRRDSDRRDSDRDRDRRDNSKSRRQHDRYMGRGSRNDLDDRRKSKDKSYTKSRMGRNTMEFKNQNRNKNNDYDGRNSTVYNRNSGSHSDGRGQPHHHQHDDEHVESVSFTNSKLNSNPNRYSNVEYSNVGSMQGREYSISQMGQEQTMVKSMSIDLLLTWDFGFLQLKNFNFIATDTKPTAAISAKIPNGVQWNANQFGFGQSNDESTESPKHIAHNESLIAYFIQCYQ